MREGALPGAAPGGPGGGQIGGDLPLRVASAAALAPLAIAAAYLGGSLFLLFWLLAGLGVLWEWNALSSAGPRSRAPQRVDLIGWAALLVAAVLLSGGWPWPALLVLLAGALFSGIAAATPSRAWSALGVVYAGVIALGPVLLRADAERGFTAILLLFAVVWATDIAAYFGGRLLGGPKLWPRVSPKKTWSGAFVGTALGVAAGLLVAGWSGLRDLFALAVLLVILSLASQAGDLWESALKRHFGVKDSGAIIPGHGGLMDRLDGFVAATFVAVLIGLARGGPDAASRGLLIW